MSIIIFLPTKCSKFSEMNTEVRDQNTSYMPGKTRSENKARTSDQNEISNSFVQA